MGCGDLRDCKKIAAIKVTKIARVIKTTQALTFRLWIT
jgi:hypothetical protein